MLIVQSLSEMPTRSGKKYILQILLAYLGRDRAMSSHLCFSFCVGEEWATCFTEAGVTKWDAQGKQYKHIQASTKHISAN